MCVFMSVKQQLNKESMNLRKQARCVWEGQNKEMEEESCNIMLSKSKNII